MNNIKNFFYVVRTVHFLMKLYNDQRNAQVFYIFPYLLLPFTFWTFLSPSLRGTVYQFGSGSSLLGMVSASEPGWNSVPGWPETCKAEASKEINIETYALCWLLYNFSL
jgi:hypothetical protein